MNNISYAFKCNSPNYKIGFIKTHKCGSDSLSGLFFRIADEYNLEVMLNKVPDDWNLAWPLEASEEMFMKSRKKSGRFDMQILHQMFYPKLWNELLEPGYNLIGVVRYPLLHFKSVFGYFGIGKRLVSELGLDNATVFDEFLTNPAKYKNHFDINKNHTILWRNPLLFDFNFRHSGLSLTRYIKFVKEKFAIVLIADYMDESLLLLKRKLCWKMKDILMITKNRSLKSSLAHFSRESESFERRDQLYRRWSSMDYEFYDSMREKLLEDISKETFFQEELTIYRKLNKLVTSHCFQETRKFNTLRINATAFSEEIIIDFEFCTRMRRNIMTFVTYMQQKQNGTLSNANYLGWRLADTLEMFNQKMDEK